MRQVWIAVVCCAISAGGNFAAAAASELLGSSRTIEQQVDAATRVRVMRTLAGLRFGSEASVVSPDQLDSQLGHNLTQTPASPADRLDQVEIEARAPRGVPEQPLEAQIPFGLPGAVWGFQHPGEAWRLLLPVLTDSSSGG